MTVFTILQNFIAIRQKEPCLRRKYVDFQKMLSDPCRNIAEKHFVLSIGHHTLVLGVDTGVAGMKVLFGIWYTSQWGIGFLNCPSFTPFKENLTCPGNFQ